MKSIYVFIKKKKTLYFFSMAIIFFLFFIKYYLTYDYKVIKPEYGKAIQVIYATGSVEPFHWARLSSMVNGEIIDILVQECQPVKKNQTLVRFEQKIENARLNQLKSKFFFLKNALERQKILKNKNIIKLKTYEETLSEYQKINSAIKTQERIIENFSIKAPFDGIILKKEVKIGEYVRSGDIVLWVGQPKPLRVVADIDEENILEVKVGQKVLLKFSAFKEKIAEGYVSHIVPKGDPVNKSFQVYISLCNNEKFMIGMSAEVNIINKEINNALLVPRQSLVNNSVFIVEGKMIHERVVKIGIIGEEQIQIISGLQKDETILFDPVNYLSSISR